MMNSRTSTPKIRRCAIKERMSLNGLPLVEDWGWRPLRLEGTASASVILGLAPDCEVVCCSPENAEAISGFMFQIAKKSFTHKGEAHEDSTTSGLLSIMYTLWSDEKLR
jgi:hypothetical protein